MAESEFRKVGRAEEIPPGTIRAFRIDEHEIAIANVDGELFATQQHCLHLHGPLGDGRLEGTTLSCPWHGWQYDVTTGKNEFDHAIQLRTYEVKIEGGDVKVAF